MNIKQIFFMYLLFTLLISTGNAVTNNELYLGFINPPAEVGPDVYWWWNASALSESEVIRELDVLKGAGIHGVLIFPLMEPIGATKIDDKYLKWLSPEWAKMLKFTVDAAKERDMYVDLLVGTGWPFGGPSVENGDGIKIIKLAKKELTGPGTFQGNIKDLMVLPPGAYGETTHGLEPKLQFLRLVPKKLEKFEPGIELKDKVKADGSIQFEIPAGQYVLYTGTYREGFIIVNIAAPGGEGPVIDHLSKPALDKYLATFENALKPYMGQQIGKNVRALHCDSFEFTGANWTADLAQEFEKRRGYSLEPYLPFVIEWPPVYLGGSFDETVNRVQYDLWKTQKELFYERFMMPFKDWCHKQGADFRNEAYGCYSTEKLSANLLPDVTMGETWIGLLNELPPDEIRIPLDKDSSPGSYGLWNLWCNKYAASGAHLNGRNTIACETMTSGSAAFRLRPEDIKTGLDTTFVSGQNHIFYHGYNSSPPEAGFPGWFYCGSYIDEKALWWPYFNEINLYTARLSWILQKSTSRSQVAVMTWENFLWPALHQNGYCVDYVNEDILQNAKMSKGKLIYGPQEYEILIMNRVDAIEPQTAKAIKDFAEAGGKIIFVDHAPGYAPGLTDAVSRSKQTNDTITEIVKRFPDRIFVIPGAESSEWLNWVQVNLAKTGIKPVVQISKPDKLLYQIHQSFEDKDIFFFANLDVNNSKNFTANFNISNKTAWRWDPATGKRYVMPYNKNANTLDIVLKPRESLLLVFEPDLTGKPVRTPVVHADDFYQIDTPWNLTLKHVSGCTIRRELTTLIDFKDDPELSKFSGTAIYQTQFEAPDLKRTFLSLGITYGISEVKLNGKTLGHTWNGDYTYDARGVLKRGKNNLEISIITTLSNFFRVWDNPVALRWTTDKGVKRLIVSEGLIGPVRLLRQD
ncbi:MAG: glycosyl hydrolase [Phycisphaerae bacterium]